MWLQKVTSNKHKVTNQMLCLTKAKNRHEWCHYDLVSNTPKTSKK